MTTAKRSFDIFCSLIGLALFWPLFALIAVLILWEDGSPVFFRQERVGFRGRLFRMLKFRSMSATPHSDGKMLTVGKDPRITRVGHYLRQLKIDELPQLINVLKGEMTLIGPRPEVPFYVAMYTPTQRKVLDLVPGITDPASIRFRHESEVLSRSPDPEATYVEEIMPQKIRLNLEYAKSATFLSDIVMILKTLRALISI